METVPLWPLRFFRPDLHHAKVKGHHHIHGREWSANVPGSASRDRADGQPPSSPSECLKVLIACLAIHIRSWVNNVVDVDSVLPSLALSVGSPEGWLI